MRKILVQVSMWKINCEHKYTLGIYVLNLKCFLYHVIHSLLVYT